MQKQRKTSRNYPGQLFSTIVLAGGGGATAQLLPEGLRITGLVVAHKATQWGKHKPDWTLPSRFFDTGSRGNRSQSGPCLSLKSMKKLLYSEAIICFCTGGQIPPASTSGHWHSDNFFPAHNVSFSRSSILILHIECPRYYGVNMGKLLLIIMSVVSLMTL